MATAAAAATAIAGTHEQRRLSTEVAVPQAIFEPTAPTAEGGGEVWNLATVLAEGTAGAEYRVYGDSLVSEEADRLRLWYAAADSCGMLRMEGLLWRVDPLTPVGIARWGASMADAAMDFTGAVARESMAPDTLRCRFARMAERSGRLVLPGADTLRAVMRGELVAVADAGGEFVQQTCRWFRAADAQARVATPVAMAFRRSYAGRELSAAAYAPDAPSIAVLMADEADDSAAPDLTLLDLRLDGRRLLVADPAGCLASGLRVDVTDLTGRSYSSATLSPGGSATLDLSALPAGSYLAVLTTPGAIRKEPLRL